MSKQYDLHLLGTSELEEEHHLYTDPAAAVIAYNRLGCEARRPATLAIASALPGMVAEVVGVYSPSADAPTIKVRLGKARPAFTESVRETGVDERGELARSWTAAYYYALGWVEAIGPLGPFSERDAIKFAEQYMPGDGVPTSWATWSAQRRQETGL